MTTMVCDYCEKGLFSVPPSKVKDVLGCPFCKGSDVRERDA